ncbi:hypothetical protein Pth03_49570 [Planotetraspora thailandica]|uniref:Uncharacterized protein n=1 Tax=Planotetraspora thailandica TaxID=487172 RepID=A0A8J3XZ67_9ACTN|nr:hypothetical protein [Planotetraspora thailandica]GII56568.1 hypothetical protein Pth03_49570 [Planotetraspora thailandica]
MPLPWKRLRNTTLATLTGVAATTSVLLVPTDGWATDRTAPAVTVSPAPREAHQTAMLATGERLEILDTGRKGASKPNLWIAPKAGQTTGRYAFTSANGKLRVRPLNQRQVVAATELATGSSTPTPAFASATATTYPVKLSIVNGGAVSFKTFIVWNRRTLTEYEVKNQRNSPNGSVSLPPGDYVSVAMHDDFPKPTYLLVRTFTVKSAGLTVRFDEKTAKETGVKVDDATTRRNASSVSISFPGGIEIGYALLGGDGKVYVNPFSLTGAALHLQEVQVKQGSSVSAPSPYRYDLSHTFQNTVPASPMFHVRTSSLAKTVTTFRAPGTDTNASLLSGPMVDDLGGMFFDSPVWLPSTVTEYVTPDVTYGRALVYGNSESVLILKDRKLPVGTSAGETVGTAPFDLRGPQYLGAYRQGTTMWLNEDSPFSDSAGNFGFDNRAKVSYELSSEGKTLLSAVDQSPSKEVRVTVPAARADYALTETVSRTVPYSRLSSQMISEWKFSSAAATRPADLPLIDIDLSVSGLDSRNTATSTVRIGATATARLRATETVTGLEYSTDDGTTWTSLPLTGTGDSASAELAVPADASFVSLRVSAVDDEGESVRRTVIRAFSGPAPQPDQTVGATKISNVVVNDGKPLAVDPFGAFFSVKFTATDPAGIADGDAYLYHGSYDRPDNVLINPVPAQCTKVNATTSTCELIYNIGSQLDLGKNSLAGPWKVAAWAHSRDRKSYTDLHAAKTVNLLRATKLSANATPEPIRKGKTLTITGKLTLANWETSTYAGFAGQSVRLQFRKAGTSTYTTIKTLTTNASGDLKTTVTASRDGYWRYSFVGNSTVRTAISAVDYVDVR